MTEKKSIHECLQAVMAEVTQIKKGSRNSFHNYMFRGVEQVMDHVGPAFRRHGIVPLPELLKLESRDVLTKKGDTNREVTVWVRYKFMGPAGDNYSIVVPGEAQDTGASGVSKAMSVAQRIAYIQALAIPTGEADPEAAAFERGANPADKLKKEIWDEGKKRGWVLEDNTYEKLGDDFAEWSQGGQIEQADEAALKDYRDHLKPPRRMQRKPQGGAA